MIDRHTHERLRRFPRSRPVCQTPRRSVGVTVITDPDTIAGVRKALAAGAAVGVIVPGIGVSSGHRTSE